MSVVGGNNDFTGLANLREQAKNDQLAAAKEVGQQFEAYFLKQMISSMRAATDSMKSELWESSSIDSYQEMFDAELSVELSKAGQLGLTDWIVTSLKDPGAGIMGSKNRAINAYFSAQQGALGVSGDDRG
jgi:flagellar protein FlgJ